MSVDEDSPSANRDPPTDRVDNRLLALVLLATAFGAGHHIDHVVRGNHVGWPLTPEVTTFTYSLLFYPLVAVGLYLTLTDRTDARYWFGLSAAGFLVVSTAHFGPWAVEPPHHVVDPHGSVYVGYLALAWVGALVATLLSATVYAARYANESAD